MVIQKHEITTFTPANHFSRADIIMLSLCRVFLTSTIINLKNDFWLFLIGAARGSKYLTWMAFETLHGGGMGGIWRLLVRSHAQQVHLHDTHAELCRWRNFVIHNATVLVNDCLSALSWMVWWTSAWLWWRQRQSHVTSAPETCRNNDPDDPSDQPSRTATCKCVW